MANTPIVKVISMCHKAHADVWRLTSDLLPDFLNADEYIVYVPNDEVAFFCEITNSKIRVLSQDMLGKSYRKALRSAVDKAGNSWRYGWYLQQFFKIEALSIHSSEADILVIWDADCVPLKEIPLCNDAMQILYMNVSSEFHRPYFDNIERLLGLTKIYCGSFVIPAFAMRQNWVTEFISFIELKHQCAWASAIIINTDFSLVSGFSETETLGTWVASSYPEAWTIVPGRWERLAQSRFGNVNSFSREKILKIGQRKKIDIMTFEHWDRRGLLRLIKRVVAMFTRWANRLIKSNDRRA